LFYTMPVTDGGREKLSRKTTSTCCNKNITTRQAAGKGQRVGGHEKKGNKRKGADKVKL
jgi:hypothetical protein